MAVTVRMSLGMKFILRNSLFFEGLHQIMTKIVAVSKQLQMPYHAVSIFLKPMILWRIPPSWNFHGWKHILGHFYDQWCYIILGSVQGQLFTFPLLLVACHLAVNAFFGKFSQQTGKNSQQLMGSNLEPWFMIFRLFAFIDLVSYDNLKLLTKPSNLPNVWTAFSSISV